MNIILGGGLSGLAAGHHMTTAGYKCVVIEKGSRVGGLAKTVKHGRFRFDLGGHRFLTDNEKLMELVSELMGDELLTVPRVSQIYLHGKFVDYPLNPINAVFGLGLQATASIILDYGREKIRQLASAKPIVSLEDWVVAQFGRKIFDLYFKDYSEKVWGIDCSEISRDWVARRIDGLSLWKLIKHALFRLNGQSCKTLTDSFAYPRLGIGCLSGRLQEKIVRNNQVRTSTEVQKVFYRDNTITGLEINDGIETTVLRGNHYFSSIPLTLLLEKMSPAPPKDVLAASKRMAFRSLVVVALMLDRQRVTDLTWLYFPGQDVPFGRIHEPTNWSDAMAPPGKTHLVVEYFCNPDDVVWEASDTDTVSETVDQLTRLGFIEPADLIDSHVLKVPYAYPVFNVDYQKNLKVVTDWLGRFNNLHLIGRSGSYSYLNMDCAMLSGIEAAEKVIGNVGAKACLPQRVAASPSLV